MSKPCPACDVAHSDDPLFCLALGVAMGNAYLDIHDITEHMCNTHRTPYVIAMVRVSQTMASLEAAHAAERQGKDRT